MPHAASPSTHPRIDRLPVDERIREYFSEMPDETPPGPATVEGDLPTWLTGTLVRNGASGFGDGAARHQLDGSALLHRFAFPGDGTATYASRYLQTKARAAMKDGRIGFHEFASDPCRRLAEPIATLFSPRLTDNASVNVAKLGDQYLALTETPLPIAFDPATLATLGVADPPPGRGIRSPTAHPHQDPRTGGWLTSQVHLGPRSSYRFFERHPGGHARQLASIPTTNPGYLHTFAITDRHIVFVEQPLRVRPLDLLTSAKPFIEQYRWQPELGTTFVVLDRHTGAVVRRHQGPAFFVLHHVNAFDDGDDVVVDLCAYEDPSIIDALYLDARGRLAAATLPTATLTRFRLAPGRDADPHLLCDTPLEWPRVAERVDGRAYEAAYGSGATYVGDVLQATVTKVDPTTREACHHHWDGCLPGEPVVVPRPTGSAEHDGVVLSVVFDPAQGRSFVGVLDARTLEEVARVQAPVRVPFGFHGDFFPMAGGTAGAVAPPSGNAP